MSDSPGILPCQTIDDLIAGGGLFSLDTLAFGQSGRSRIQQKD